VSLRPLSKPRRQLFINKTYFQKSSLALSPQVCFAVTAALRESSRVASDIELTKGSQGRPARAPDQESYVQVGTGTLQALRSATGGQTSEAARWVELTDATTELPQSAVRSPWQTALDDRRQRPGSTQMGGRRPAARRWRSISNRAASGRPGSPGPGSPDFPRPPLVATGPAAVLAIVEHLLRFPIVTPGTPGAGNTRAGLLDPSPRPAGYVPAGITQGEEI
jgi:hypothetical protein